MPYKHTTKSGKRDMRYKRENNPYMNSYSNNDISYIHLVNHEEQKNNYSDKVKKRRNYILIAIIAITCFVGVLLIIPSIKKAEMQKKQAQSDATIQIINSATVFGGYKPCFGTGNAFSNTNKIAIIGAIDYNSISDIFRVGYSENQTEYARDLTPHNYLSLDKTFVRTYFSNNDINLNNTWNFPYYGIIFLSKKDNIYILDNVIPVRGRDFNSVVQKITTGSIINYTNDILRTVLPALDTWILENADK